MPETRDNEEVIHIYHLGLEWIAKASMLNADNRAKLRSRLKTEAARAQSDDSVALRCLDNICQVYENDL